MKSDKEILSTIKSIVQEEVPDAKIFLFGSRATGKVHEESDWDILAITSIKVSRELKNSIREKLYPPFGADYFFVDLTLVNKNDWFESPSYYVLRQSIKNQVLEI